MRSWTPLWAGLWALSACTSTVDVDPTDASVVQDAAALDAGTSPDSGAAPDAEPGPDAESAPDVDTTPDAEPAPDAEPPADPCVDPIRWAPGPELPVSVDHHHTFTSTLGGGPALYVLGGFGDAGASNAVHRAAIRADGGLEAFVRVGTLPAGRAGAALLVDGRTIVLAGGYVGRVHVASVVIGTLAEDGTVGQWRAGPALPGIRFHAAGAVVDGTAYVTGGVTSTGDAQATVFTSTLSAGVLGEWQAQAPLPAPRSHHALFVADDALWIVSGLSGNPFRNRTTTYDDLLRIELGAGGRPEPAVEVRAGLGADLSTHAATPAEGCFLVFGGGRGDAFEANVDVQRFELAGAAVSGAAPVVMPAGLTHRHHVPRHGPHFYAVAGSLHHVPTAQVWVGTVGH